MSFDTYRTVTKDGEWLYVLGNVIGLGRQLRDLVDVVDHRRSRHLSNGHRGQGQEGSEQGEAHFVKMFGSN